MPCRAILLKSSSDFSNAGVLMEMVLEARRPPGLGSAFDAIRNLNPQQMEQAPTSGTGAEGLFMSARRVFETPASAMATSAWR